MVGSYEVWLLRAFFRYANRIMPMGEPRQKQRNTRQTPLCPLLPLSRCAVDEGAFHAVLDSSKDRKPLGFATLYKAVLCSGALIKVRSQYITRHIAPLSHFFRCSLPVTSHRAASMMRGAFSPRRRGLPRTVQISWSSKVFFAANPASFWTQLASSLTSSHA